MTNFFASILSGLYDIIGNYGLTIIIFTLIVRIALLPLGISQKKSMEKTSRINPMMVELKKKYGHDKELYNQKMMELYRKEKINPLGGCLPLLIQIPIIFVLFGIFRNAGKYLPAEALQQSFLWLPNMVNPDTLSNIIPGVEFMTKVPGIWPMIAALFTYLTSKRSNQQMQKNTQGQGAPNMSFMTTLFPLMILVFGVSYSAGLIVYWSVSNIFQFCQDIVLTNHFNRNKEMIN